MTIHDTDIDAGLPRVSWSAVIAGALIAVAIGAMLNLLGVAMGAAAIDPFDMSRADAKGLAVAGGIWLAIANAIALFIGAWIAARTGRDWDLRNAGLHSVAVWALAFAMAMTIAGLTGTGFVGTLIRGAAEQPQIAAASVAEAASAPGPNDPNLVPAPSLNDQAAMVQSSKNTTSALAGWAFLSMLLGLIAALLGGWMATRGAHIGLHPARRVRETTYSTDPTR